MPLSAGEAVSASRGLGDTEKLSRVDTVAVTVTVPLLRRLVLGASEMLGEAVTDTVLDPALLALGDPLEMGDWEEVGLTRLLAVPPSFVRVAEGVPVPAGEVVGRWGEGVAVAEVAALAVERGPEGVLETLGLEVALGESEAVLLEQLEAALLRVPAPAVGVGAREAVPQLLALSRVDTVPLGEARGVALSLGVREAVELDEAEGTREGVDAGVDVPP